MRITFVLPVLSVNGGTRVVAVYADRLARRGHQVAVVAGRAAPPRLRHRVTGLLRGRGWAKAKPERDDLFRGSGARVAVLDRARPMRSDDLPDADVVVATWWRTAEWVAALPAGKGVKVYLVQHDEREITPQDRDRVAGTWRLPLHKVAVARWLAELGRDEFGQRVAVVANGVDVGQFTAPPRARGVPPTVGLVYSRSPFKAVDVALAAVARLRAALPELGVVSFGGHDPNEGLPLPPGTRFEKSPPQGRLAALYAAADVWLVSSRSEGFGLPVLEAMACRTPVVATATGAAPELLRDGAGVTVPVGDSAAMAAAALPLLTGDAARWRAAADAAWATAQRYCWEASVEAFERELVTAAAGAEVRA